MSILKVYHSEGSLDPDFHWIDAPLPTVREGGCFGSVLFGLAVATALSVWMIS